MPLMILGVNLLGYITSSITNIVQVSSHGLNGTRVPALCSWSWSLWFAKELGAELYLRA